MKGAIKISDLYYSINGTKRLAKTILNNLLVTLPFLVDQLS